MGFRGCVVTWKVTHTHSPLPSLCSAIPPWMLSWACHEGLAGISSWNQVWIQNYLWGGVGAETAAEEGPALGQLHIFMWNREYSSVWEKGSLPGQAPIPVGNLELGFIVWFHALEKPDGSMNVTWHPEERAGLGESHCINPIPNGSHWVNPMGRRIWVR